MSNHPVYKMYVPTYECIFKKKENNSGYNKLLLILIDNKICITLSHDHLFPLVTIL